MVGVVAVALAIEVLVVVFGSVDGYNGPNSDGWGS
jgi:hypothetical protein